jgi:translation initiation factor IF-2
MEDEREARNIALKRQQLQREQSLRTKKHLTIEEIGRRIALGDFKELNLIVKGDVDGSVEALTDSLQKLSPKKYKCVSFTKALDKSAKAMCCLQVHPMRLLSVSRFVQVQVHAKLRRTKRFRSNLYSIIYKAIEEVKEAMEGMLSARIEEKVVGTAEIREVFKISKVGTIAGCMVLDGKIHASTNPRDTRWHCNSSQVNLVRLKRFKDDVKEVVKGYECGLNVDKFNNIEVGDIIEAFEEVEVKQKKLK